MIAAAILWGPLAALAAATIWLGASVRRARRARAELLRIAALRA